MAELKSVRVIDIILDSSHEKFNNNDDIGTIFFKPIEGTLRNIAVNNSDGLPPAKPLFSFVKTFPLIEEIVLIIKSQGNSSPLDEVSYYFPAINIWNHPHHGAYPFGLANNESHYGNSIEDYKKAERGIEKKYNTTLDEEISLGNYFQELENIRPLLPYEGDTILEGRFGNSIRFGATTNNINNPNRWSKEGKVGNPITIIRNGQIGDERGNNIEPIVEDVDGDDSSIYLTSNQQLTNFTPASTNFKSWDGTNLDQVKKTKKDIVNPNLNNQIEPEIIEQPLPKEEEPVIIEPVTPTSEEVEEISEKTFEDSSNVTEYYTDTNKITPSSTITLNKGTLRHKIISEEKDPEFIEFQEVNLDQPIGANFTLKHLISSETAQTPTFGIHEDAELERIGIYFHSTGESATGAVEGYYIKDILGFYEGGGGFDKWIIIKDSDMNIIHEGTKSFSMTIKEMLDEAEVGMFGAGSMYYIWNMPNPGINNYPGIDSDLISGDEIVSNLKKVVENCIDKIIEQFPSLEIISAYRSAEVDNCVDASAGLDHVRGHAIDFRAPGTNTSEIFNWCFENLEEWKDLMWAYPERGEDSWVHISYKEGENEKHTTLASEIDSIHEWYESDRRGSSQQYQDGILEANQELIQNAQ